MKLWSSRFSAPAASAATLGALILIQVTGAAPASAASELCPAGQSPDCMIVTPAGDPVTFGAPGTQFDYPDTVGAIGAIKEVGGASLCLQLDASGQGLPNLGSAAPNTVRSAACVGDLAEEWENVYNSTYRATEFVSIYAVDNSSDYNSGILCLGDAAELNIGQIGECSEASGWDPEWVS